MEAFGPSFDDEAAAQLRDLRRATTQDIKARKERQRGETTSSDGGDLSRDTTDHDERSASPAKRAFRNQLRVAEDTNVARVAAAQAKGARNAFKDIVIRRNHLSVDWQGNSILGLPMYEDIQLNLRLGKAEMSNLDAIAEGLDVDGGRVGGKGEVSGFSANWRASPMYRRQRRR